MGIFKGWPFVEMTLVYLIYFLLMIVLFCHASMEKCQKMLEILEIYKRGSRQKINREKTNIFFSSNTSQPIQSCIQQLLGVPTIRQYEKYLGLPSLVG